MIIILVKLIYSIFFPQVLLHLKLLIQKGLECKNYDSALNNLDILNHLLGNYHIPVDWNIVCESDIVPVLLQILDDEPKEGFLPIIINILIDLSTADARHIEYIYDLKIVLKLFHLLRVSKSEAIMNDVSIIFYKKKKPIPSLN